MKFLIAVTILGVASAAPLGNLELLQRAKSASYGPYGPPCAGGGQGQPISLYLSPQPNLPPMYRETNVEDSARSYYDSGVGSASSGSASTSTSSGSTVIGLFPDAKIDSCALPLLLNCAPNVVSGHIEKPKTPYSAYRTEEDEHSVQRRDAIPGKVFTETQMKADKLEDKNDKITPAASPIVKSKVDSLKEFEPKKE